MFARVPGKGSDIESAVAKQPVCVYLEVADVETVGEPKPPEGAKIV